jgi:hypothetical protein
MSVAAAATQPAISPTALARVAAARIVAVAYGFFAAAEDELTGCGGDPAGCMHITQSERRYGLACEILEQALRSERRIVFMAAQDTACEPSLIEVKRDRVPRRDLLVDAFVCFAVCEFLQVGCGEERMSRKLRANCAGKALLEPHEIEVVRYPEDAVKLVFGHDLAKRRPPLRLRDRISIPRPRHRFQVVGIDRTYENLFGAYARASS